MDINGKSAFLADFLEVCSNTFIPQNHNIVNYFIWQIVKDFSGDVWND